MGFNVNLLKEKGRKPFSQMETRLISKKKILFVCTGNIARSASAQYIAEQLSGSESGWTFDSAGTGAVIGSGVAPFIDAELESRGVNFHSHQAKQITAQLLEESALVLVMEKEHLNWIVREWPQYHSKIHLLKQMARVREKAGRRVNPVDFMAALDEPPAKEDRIADPYRKGPEAARVAVEEVEMALTKIIPWLGA
ncbi:arsenate reductase/protein-tyrosine-phosphatase family protein [Rothia sp. 11254D007CT]